MADGVITGQPIKYPNGFETVDIDIDFSASAEEDVEITLSKTMQEVLRGRLWIDEDPGAGFVQWLEYTLYNKSTMKGEDAIFRATAKMVYTELATATTGSDSNIIPDDHTDFSPNDLVYILDDPDSEYCRIETVASTMIAEDIVGAHDVNDGVVRVSEFSGFQLYSLDGDRKVYLRCKWSAAQTVSMHMELILRV